MNASALHLRSGFGMPEMISGTEPAADQLLQRNARPRSSDDISVTVLRILCETAAVVHAAVRGIADCSSFATL
jgi:hypothetical protein